MKAGILRPLYDVFGGYATVYLDTDVRAAGRADAIELRWRAARDELGRRGARDETLEAIGNLVTDAGQDAPGRAVFARDGRVTGAIGLRTAPGLPVAEFAPLPHLRAALADAPPAVPHLRVSVNRAGGEIVTNYGPDVHATGEITGEITAGPWSAGTTSAGGWFRARYRRSAEHAWEENAEELAGRIAQEAGRSGAEFIVVAGDVRARSVLAGLLARSLRDLVVMLDAEVDADDVELVATADAAATRLATLECERRLDQWRELTGRSQAAEGIQATIAAVRDGQAAAVFLCEDAALGSLAWLGVEGTDLATSQAELAERGVLAPLPERADEAIIRAAASTDADLFIVPAGLAAEYAPKEGVCATLRRPAPEPA